MTDLSTIAADNPPPSAGGKPRDTRELTGTVDRVLWQDDAAAVVIARLRSGEVVKGPIDDDGLAVGTAYRFLGRWVKHPKHGDQFAFQTYTRDTPHERAGILKYLTDECPGVGQKRAQQLWEHFGGTAVEVVRSDPARVVAAGILSVDAAHEAAAALQAVAALEATRIDLFSLFASRGFTGQTIKTCIERWGAKAADVVRRNPYALLVAEIPAAGWKRSDKLYLDLGYPKAARKRQALCLWNHLRTSSEGHTWHAAAPAANAVAASVGEGADPVAAVKLAKRGRLISTWRDGSGVLWLAEAEKARAEWRLSERLRDLMRGAARWPIPAADRTPLTPHQWERAQQALAGPVGILVGTPGTGKTFTAAEIARAIVAACGRGCVAVCAPTGKAAVRCSAAMHEYRVPVETTTIHRLLKIGRNGHDGKGWGFQHHEQNPLPYRFLVVDEVSMLDTGLAADLLGACAADTNVLFVGDPYQLPPVGHGAPLRDMLAAGIPSGELTEIKRNAGLIVHACRDVKDGKPITVAEQFDEATGQNLRLFSTANAEESIETLRGILRQFRVSDRFDPTWETQVVVAVNAKSALSRHELNRILQDELNPTGQHVEPNPFRIGDKIICLKNGQLPLVELGPGSCDHRPDEIRSYGPARDECGQPREDFLANGEIGRVVAVDAKITIAKFNFPDRLVKIPMGKPRDRDKDDDQGGANGDGASDGDTGRSGDFDLAYAVTVHKMQGSEAPCVICMIDDHGGARRVANREWWYTAISRAKRLCVLIGRRAMMEQQARRVSLNRRKTFLRELLNPSQT